jgi:hypothetical protein
MMCAVLSVMLTMTFKEQSEVGQDAQKEKLSNSGIHGG